MDAPLLISFIVLDMPVLISSCWQFVNDDLEEAYIKLREYLKPCIEKV